MKCYYQYLNDSRSSIKCIVISENPLIIVDIDEKGNTMGIEYCEYNGKLRND